MRQSQVFHSRVICASSTSYTSHRHASVPAPTVLFHRSFFHLTLETRHCKTVFPYICFPSASLLQLTSISYPTALVLTYLHFLSVHTTPSCLLFFPCLYFPFLHLPHSVALLFCTKPVLHNFGSVLSTSSPKFCFRESIHYSAIRLFYSYPPIPMPHVQYLPTRPVV